MVVSAGPWLAVCGAAAAENATTQPSESAPQQWRIRPGLLHLNMLDGYLGFESDYEYRRVEYLTPPKSNYKNRDFRLTETVGLMLAGDVVDPNLVDWQASIEGGPIQGSFREVIDAFSHEEKENGFLLRYDVSVDAMKNKPVSVHAYARQFDGRVPRRFLPSLHEYVTEAGASVLVQSGILTTEGGFAYRDTRRHGNRLEEDDETLTTHRYYLTNKLRFSDTHQLRLSFEHEREESSYQGSAYEYDTDRNEVRADHELAFGPESKHRLDTYLQYDVDRGDLALNQMELSPRLTLQHSDKLQTIYRYSYYRLEQDAIEASQHKFDVQAVYKPTDRLRLTTDGFVLYERDDSNIHTQDYGGEFDVAYDRPTPWGKLSSNVAFAYDSARTSGQAGRRIVRAEAHGLSTLKPAVLRQRDVVRESILAFNADRTRLYVVGVDYSVVMVGRRAVIRRLPFGRIAEGEAVYFDYQYDVPVHADVDTYRTDFMIEHEFTFGLTPYYYLESRCEDVSASRGLPVVKDNQHRHRLGVRYTRERWSVTNEFEVFDDFVEPYRAWHLLGQAALLRRAGASLDANAELSRYCFWGGGNPEEGSYYGFWDDPQAWLASRCNDCGEVSARQVWWFDVDVKGTVEIDRFLSLNGGLGYHYDGDPINGKTNGVEAKCGLKYVRGLLTVELTAEYDLLNIGPTREEGVGIWLNIRRDLGDLLASSRKAR
jgi:hypothetical protein